MRAKKKSIQSHKRAPNCLENNRNNVNWLNHTLRAIYIYMTYSLIRQSTCTIEFSINVAAHNTHTHAQSIQSIPTKYPN